MKIEKYLRENIDNLNQPRSWRDRVAIIFKGIFMLSKGLIELTFPSPKNFKANGLAQIGLSFIALAGGLLLKEYLPNPYPEFLLFEIFLLLISVIVAQVIFATLIVILIGADPDEKLRKKIIRNYKKKLNGTISFSEMQYVKAAEVLRIFNACCYEDAKERYGEELVELLIMGNGIFQNKGQLKRLISIKALEADSDAGWEE